MTLVACNVGARYSAGLRPQPGICATDLTLTVQLAPINDRKPPLSQACHPRLKEASAGCWSLRASRQRPASDPNFLAKDDLQGFAVSTIDRLRLCVFDELSGGSVTRSLQTRPQATVGEYHGISRTHQGSSQ